MKEMERKRVWFVPVRSIKKTLAVLIIHICVDASSISNDRRLLDPPQSIASHFAAMFASCTQLPL